MFEGTVGVSSSSEVNLIQSTDKSIKDIFHVCYKGFDLAILFGSF